MKKKMIGFSIVLFVLLSGCATMKHTEQANVIAGSGAAVPVKILANGLMVYEGNLPATIPVKSGTTYTVVYTTPDGESRTVQIAEKFNKRFIGSLCLGFVPAIVDLATQNVMQIEETTILPISYSPMIILGEHIPYNPHFQPAGTFDYQNETVQNSWGIHTISIIGY